MRFSALLLAVLVGTGCTTVDPLYCEESSQCADPSRPFCDLTGEHPASGGVARTCIPDPNSSPGDGTDAGAPGNDASADAGAEKPDARAFTYPEPHVYWAFDEQDVSGVLLVARHGDLSGAIEGPTRQAGGIVADALAFAGGADQVDFDNALDELFSGPDRTFSISVWVNPAETPGTQLILAKAGAPTCDPPEDTRQLDLLLLDGVPSFRFWTPANANARFLLAATPLEVDVWSHLLVTYDGTIDSSPTDRVQLYVDGVPQPMTVSGSLGDFPYDIQPTGAHLAFGNIVGSEGERCGPEELTAQLDEVAVWSTVLGPEHAAEVHERGRATQLLWPR
jgi:Concanavalin A-like lectin/glucanases superfamily